MRDHHDSTLVSWKQRQGIAEGGNQQTYLYEQKTDLGQADTGARNLPPSNVILELGGFLLDLIAGETSENFGARGAVFSNEPMSLGGHMKCAGHVWEAVAALWPMCRL